MIKKIVFFFIILISSISFSQEKSIDKLIASPNPFANTTKISFYSSTTQDIFISIKNVLGKTVFSKKINAKEGENNFPFYRNNLRSGMYIYSIQSTKEFISKRFIIR